MVACGGIEPPTRGLSIRRPPVRTRPHPQLRATGLQVRQVDPQVKFQLVVVGRHVGTQLVEGAVVLALPEVRQLVHRDHGQKGQRRVLEQRRHPDLAFGLEP